MEGRSRQHQTVEQRYRDADRDPLLHVFQHPAANRAVDVQMVADTRVRCGNHIRLPIDAESDVADERLVDDGVDCVTVVAAAVALPGYGCTRGFRISQGSLPKSGRENGGGAAAAKGPVSGSFGSRCDPVGAASRSWSAAAHQHRGVVALEPMDGAPI